MLLQLLLVVNHFHGELGEQLGLGKLYRQTVDSHVVSVYYLGTVGQDDPRTPQ